MVTIDKLKEVHQHLKDGITKTQNRISPGINSKRKMAPQLKKGEKVYLLTKNLKGKRPTKKLAPVKVGPFLIDKVKGPVNYRLKLPKDAGKIHPVFHISLLEPADPGTPLQETFHFEPEENDQYEVETIKLWNGQKYLIKWKGYPDSENTWEPTKHLLNSYQKLKEFHRQYENGNSLKRPHETKTMSLRLSNKEAEIAKLRPDLSTPQNFRRWLHQRKDQRSHPSRQKARIRRFAPTS